MKSSIAIGKIPICVVFAWFVQIQILVGCSAEGVATKPGGNRGDSALEDTTKSDALSNPDKDSHSSNPQEASIIPDTALDERGTPREEPFCTNSDLHGDSDNDGWSVAEGDCNDCTALMNPGAYDFPDDGIDEDCDGIKDNAPQNCDNELDEAGEDPLDAARALGLCQIAELEAPKNKATWGVISAKYVYPNGSSASKRPLSVEECIGDGNQNLPPNSMSRGILTHFGKHIKPKQGGTMLALSTGVARSGTQGDSPSRGKMCTASIAPEGFPTPSKAACPNHKITDSRDINDAIAFELKIRTPSNAKGFSFDFNFFTYEYPTYVCSKFNDFFVALMWPQRSEKALHYNISFDSKGNPVSVNNSFLEVCKPGTHNGKQFDCSLGTTELVGTGFENKGSTSWLRTSSPINGGEIITLRFAIWDTGDQIYDSTVLLDNIRWDLEVLDPETIRPPR